MVGFAAAMHTIPPGRAVGGSGALTEALVTRLRSDGATVSAGEPVTALRPMRLFHWSNSYLALVFVAAAVDPAVGLPIGDMPITQSQRDVTAPTLKVARQQGLLPDYETCLKVEAALWA